MNDKRPCDFPWVGEKDQQWHRCTQTSGHIGHHTEHGDTYNYNYAPKAEGR